MLATRITQKGQVTIPSLIRKKLNIKTGDRIKFDLKNDQVTLSKVNQEEKDYLDLLTQGFAKEWGSEADSVYDDL